MKKQIYKGDTLDALKEREERIRKWNGKWINATVFFSLAWISYGVAIWIELNLLKCWPIAGLASLILFWAFAPKAKKSDVFKEVSIDCLCLDLHYRFEKKIYRISSIQKGVNDKGEPSIYIHYENQSNVFESKNVLVFNMNTFVNKGKNYNFEKGGLVIETIGKWVPIEGSMKNLETFLFECLIPMLKYTAY